MTRQTWARVALGLAALLPLSTANFAQAQALDELERSFDEPTIGEPPPEVPTGEGADDGAIDGIEELTRGPVHEAFAEQVSADAKPGLVAPEAPPEPINEVAPESKPADAKAIWIDGYWAYDDVDERFIWISGVWRVAPTGYRWTPGYWTEAEGGWRWIGGFWAVADRAEVAYQPEPPASLEEGPTSEAPSADHIWVPGCWYYRDDDYAWRPGYWTEGNDNWVWIPNYYRYTPRGHVLCGGYWDVPLATRGCLFAPVYFNEPIYTTPNWYYTPRVSIGLGALHFHMFVRPNYCHYYFGDYYGHSYASRGWYPWHTFHRHRHWHDPLFAFNVWHFKRRGIDFHDRYDRWHKYYDRHEDHRPRHTWKDQRDWAHKHRDGDRDDWKHSAIGQRFEDQVRDRRDRFVSVDKSDRDRFDAINDRVRDFRRERAKSESVADARDGRDGEGRDRRGDSQHGDGRGFPRLRLPDAVSGDRSDRDGRDESQRSDRPGPDGRDLGDRTGDFDRRDGDRRDGDRRDDERGEGERGDRSEPPRNVLRPDLGRDGDSVRGRFDRDERDPRGDEAQPSTPARQTPETPSATPSEGRNDALPSLPRVDPRERGRSSQPDRSSLLPQPGTVRDSERPFNIERRSEDSRRGDLDRRGSTESQRISPPSTDGATPRADIDRPRVDLPRVDNGPRIESPTSRSFNRDSFERGDSGRRSSPSIRSGGDRPSINPSAPRIQQTPSIDRGSSAREFSPRTQVQRPSLDRGSSPTRSISPRSSGRSIGGAGSSFAPRSSGGGRGSSPSFRSSGGGGGSSSFRSGGSGRSGGSSFSGGRSGGGGRGRGGRD